MNSYKAILSKYLPEHSVNKVIGLLERYPCHLKIVGGRRTKHGDFRLLPDGSFQITVNHDLNPYQFLLTLIHELAHLVTFLENKHVKPHGMEWKLNFQELFLPFFDPEILPSELMPYLANYMRNPRASTGSDVQLSLALKSYDKKKPGTLVFQVPEKAQFVHNNRIFIKGSKRRTRHECTEVKTGKKYLFHQNAEVELIKS